MGTHIPKIIIRYKYSNRYTYIKVCTIINMVYVCKDECRYCTSEKKAMINIKPSIAYLVANRCSICSESNESIWYLKTLDKCLCCGTTLRRKSKHSLGRQKVTDELRST